MFTGTDDMDYSTTEPTTASPVNESVDETRESGSISCEDSQMPLSPMAATVITENNYSTPLLRIPLVIRTQIYELVCGGQLLHIVRCWTNGKLRLKCRICCAEISEQAAEDLFHAEATDQWSVSVIEDRHKDCFNDKSHAEEISTRFLLTCRQVYDEARHIPYTTNTFGFNYPLTMDKFTSYLRYSGFGHHLEIRRVYLNIEERDFEGAQSWKTAVTHCLLPRLSEVHHISINLHQGHSGSVRSWYPAEIEACRGSKILRNVLISALLELGRLSLSRVNFVISDKGTRGGFHWHDLRNSELPRMKLAEKQVWARHFKDSLLRKDNQLALSSGLAVEAPKSDVKGCSGDVTLAVSS